MADDVRSRRKPTENENIILFGEVEGVCPKCHHSLMSKSGGNLVKTYEVAHIYPWSPRPHEVELLHGLERLSSDVDDIANLIALCRPCHKIFDNPRTVEGYLEMVSIKKELARLAKIKSDIASGALDGRITQIVESLLDNGNEETTLSMEAMKIKDKLVDPKTISLRVKITGHVNYFYNFIKDRFAELDSITPGSSELIYTQVRARFLELKLNGYSQAQIFDAMTEWISVKSGGSTNDSEVVASFFVQNCEIFP